MKAIRSAGGVSVVMAFLAWSPQAHAAARVFISVSGTDAGDCSNVAAPCRTFNFAIAAVDVGGEVIVLTTGSYAGATVNKSVRIDVPSGVVAFSASSLVVAAGPSDSVTIRGVTLKSLTPGSGNGIDFQSGKELSIENCVIDSFSTGILVSSLNSPNVYLIDTIVRNGFRGIDSDVASGASNVVIHNSRFVNHSNCHVHSHNNSTISAQDTVTSGNGFGFCASIAASAVLNCLNCLASGHASAGFGAFTAATVRVSSSMATRNGTGFNNSSSTFESLGNSLVAGNSLDTNGTITIIGGH
jgi:hypothetical protein